MPYGKGTYGRKKGRPPEMKRRKRKDLGEAMDAQDLEAIRKQERAGTADVGQRIRLKPKMSGPARARARVERKRAGKARKTAARAAARREDASTQRWYGMAVELLKEKRGDKYKEYGEPATTAVVGGTKSPVKIPERGAPEAKHLAARLRDKRRARQDSSTIHTKESGAEALDERQLIKTIARAALTKAARLRRGRKSQTSPTEEEAQASGRTRAEKLIKTIQTNVAQRLSQKEESGPLPKTPEEVRKVTANMNPLQKKQYMKRLKQTQGSNVVDMATIWSSGGNV